MTTTASLITPLRSHRPLLVATVLSLAVAAAATIGLFVDSRELVGAPIWLKAWKFGVSIAIYTVTIAWMLAALPGRSRWTWWLGTVIAVCISVENVLIVLQIVRGSMSHFNFRTPFDSTVFVTMGIAIVLVWLANLFLGIILAVRPLASPSLTAGVRWGVAVSLVGMAMAFLMTVGGLGVIDAPGGGIEGAHTVGALDGGPGMPVTGWSTVAGDLRVPHFVGIHALQALPLFTLFLARLAGRLPLIRGERTRVRLAHIAGPTALGVVVLLTWQAARGQSVAHPDAATIVTASALLTTAAASVAWVLWRETKRRVDVLGPSGDAAEYGRAAFAWVHTESPAPAHRPREPSRPPGQAVPNQEEHGCDEDEPHRGSAHDRSGPSARLDVPLV